MELTLLKGPEDFQNNFIYRKWVRGLVTREIYDTTDYAYPYIKGPFTFRLTSSLLSTKAVYLNNILILSTAATTVDFKVYLQPNSANVLRAVDDLGDISETLFINVYNLHFFVFTISSQVYDLYKIIAQSMVDKTLTLDNSAGVLASDLVISDNALFTNFGDIMKVRRINDTHDEYLTKLKNVWDAFYYGCTIKGFKQLLGAFTTGDVDFITYLDLEELRTSTKTYVKRRGTLQVEWLPSEIILNSYKYILNYGYVSLSASSETFLYLDGSTDVNGYLEVKTATTEPVGTESVVSEDTDDIFTDTEGLLTGLENGKYVILNHPVIELISVSSDGPFNVKGAELIEGTNVLFLRTDWDDVDIGTVTINYRANTRSIVLAKVTTDGTDITKIEDPIPSRGAIYRTRYREESDFELYIDDQNFTAKELVQLVELLTDINTPVNIGHLYVKDTTVVLTDYEYHKNNFRFVDYV